MNYNPNITLQSIYKALNTNSFDIFSAKHKEVICKYIKYFHVNYKVLMSHLIKVINITKRMGIVSSLNDDEIKIALHEQKLLLGTNGQNSQKKDIEVIMLD